MRLLITGASGQLGGYLLREARRQALTAVAWSGTRTGELFGYPLRPVDFANPLAITRAFQEAQPTTIIHAAALARVAECHAAPDRAHAINTWGSFHLAGLAHQAGARFVHVSTDLVFCGKRGGYRENNVPSPISVYGRTKAAAEQLVRTYRSAVVRLSLLFGPSVVGRASFFDDQVAALRQRRPVTLFEDEWRTPLDLATAARSLLTIARSDLTGILHLGGPERMSRLEMGRRLAAFLGCDPGVIVSARRDEVPSPEPRPRDTSLDSSRWRGLFPNEPWPAWDEALHTLMAE